MGRPEWLVVGHIAGTHGIRGEVRVISRTDYPEVRFAPGSQLLLSQENKEEMLPLTVERSRPHKKGYILQFRDWTDINQSESLKGGTLVVDPEEAVDGGDDEFYFHEILGCEVFTTDGNRVGIITDILQPGANDVWVVRPPEGGRDWLIPYIDDVVQDVDVSAKRVVIHWMEGLEDSR
ncbi:ribosome maturation factor RimM [Desmospora profundinema]|uniref:Ribosome maturation factor RimM n=1 Tax=Desmospora profundinema TaxID=1571184 RepID=A0ABU1IU53_9BACL|nr:ribosome maturation factor RimM [Desmospora profundinema]MDR6227290.1 16S rRNA processing protein RimM [Desmospora profundinema]